MSRSGAGMADAGCPASRLKPGEGAPVIWASAGATESATTVDTDRTEDTAFPK
jgi:hypothetical protein